MALPLSSRKQGKMNLDLLQNMTGAAAALATLPGTVELGMLSIGSFLPAASMTHRSCSHEKVRLAVVIPAHNERESIAACLDSLLRDNAAVGASIIVVADNCTDETAAIAVARGVEVLERSSLTERGKGYALNYAFRHLAARDFDAYVIVDADSVVPSGFLHAFKRTFVAGADAAQCAYLVSNGDENDRTRLLDLALRAFNWIRPLGRARLGISAGILGNGFALRKQTLERVPYTAHSVVEDLEYHLALVEKGYTVTFIESTRIYGAMPAGGRGRETQRARWEGGRLRMLREHGLRLTRMIATGRSAMVEPLLDLLLLPLGFHAMLLALAMLSSNATVRFVGLAGCIVVLLHVAAAMRRGPSLWEDLRVLASVPRYVLWKLARLPLIVTASGRRAAWVRTERAVEVENS